MFAFSFSRLEEGAVQLFLQVFDEMLAVGLLVVSVNRNHFLFVCASQYAGHAILISAEALEGFEQSVGGVCLIKVNGMEWDGTGRIWDMMYGVMSFPS